MRQKGSETRQTPPARKAGETTGRDTRYLDSLADLAGRLEEAARAAGESRAFLDCLGRSSAIVRAALYLADAHRGTIELHESFGMDGHGSFPAIGTRSAFATWIARAKGPVPIDDFFAAAGAGEEDEAFLGSLVEAGCAKAAPLLSGGMLVGVLAYAEPRSAAPSVEAGAEGDRFVRAASAILAGSIVGGEAARERRDRDRVRAVKRDALDRACGELGSPLRMLRSALSSLDPDDASDAVLVDMARGAVARLEETAAFARSLNGIDADASPLGLERIEVRSLVDDALREAIPELEEKEISVTTDDGTVFRPVRVDQEAVAAALRSMLAGVVAFAPRGGTVSVSLAVAIDGEDRDEGIEIGAPNGRGASSRRGAQSRGEPLASVSIGGEGIALPGVEAFALADPFALAASASDERVRSLGVGLGVASSVAARHDGTLFVEYDAGRIMRLTMRLPLVE